MAAGLHAVDGNLWILRYPLRLMGVELGRNVTVCRLESGEVVVHSTAPFSAADAAAIRSLGDPVTLVEASLFHDSFAAEGRRAFPEARYLAPPGFRHAERLSAEPLDTAPAAWGEELQVLPLAGMPGVREHVFFHAPSRTLILADLLFNVGPDAPRWTRGFLRFAAGIKARPGMSRFFKLAIRDRRALAESLDRMRGWDYERVIVAHGEPVPSGGKAVVADALRREGLCP